MVTSDLKKEMEGWENNSSRGKWEKDGYKLTVTFDSGGK